MPLEERVAGAEAERRRLRLATISRIEEALGKKNQMVVESEDQGSSLARKADNDWSERSAGFVSRTGTRRALLDKVQRDKEANKKLKASIISKEAKKERKVSEQEEARAEWNRTNALHAEAK